MLEQGFSLQFAEEKIGYCSRDDGEREKPDSVSLELLMETHFINLGISNNLFLQSRMFLLISSDYDFTYSLRKFRRHGGYTILLALKTDMNYSCPEFKTEAHYAWW